MFMTVLSLLLTGQLVNLSHYILYCYVSRSIYSIFQPTRKLTKKPTRQVMLKSFAHVLFQYIVCCTYSHLANTTTNKKVSSANGRQLFVSTPSLSLILRLSFLSISSCYIVDQPCIIMTMMRMMMVAMMTTVRVRITCVYKTSVSASVG